MVKGDASGAVCSVGTTGVKCIVESTLSRYLSLSDCAVADSAFDFVSFGTCTMVMVCIIGCIGAETEVSIVVIAVVSIAHDTSKVV